MIFHRALDFWNPMNRNIIIDILKKEKPDIIHTNNIYEITPIIWKTAKEMEYIRYTQLEITT